MEFSIRKIDYFNTTVKDLPGEAYKFLSQLTKIGVNLEAFTAVPVGPMQTQLSIFPEDSNKLKQEAVNSSLQLDGPYPALLVQGDDELGALAEVHEKLYEADVNVYASSGASDGKGSFGYIIYVRHDDYHRALDVLGIK